MAIKFLYVLAVLALLNHGRIVPKMKNPDPAPCTTAVYDPPCTCDGEYQDAGCICASGTNPLGCVCDPDSEGYDFATCTSDMYAAASTECTDTDDEEVDQNTCRCADGFSPENCVCPKGGDIGDLVGVPKERCECLAEDDPRTGGECPVTDDCVTSTLEQSKRGCFCTDIYSTPGCTCKTGAANLQPVGCVCDDDSDAEWPLADCQAAQICTGYEVPSPLCTCTGATKTSNAYSQADCEEDKACPKVVADSVTPSGRCVGKSIQCTSVSKLETLLGVDIVTCPCKTTGDPRAGDTCLAYCVDNEYEEGCACDEGEADYAECEADKAYAAGLPACTGTTGGDSVDPNTCKCSGSGFSPTGCTCPREGASLVGVPTDKCTCEDVEGDARVGVTCLVTKPCTTDSTKCLCSQAHDEGTCTCTSEHKNQACVCSEIAGAYDFETCQATKICTAFEEPNEHCTCTGATKTSNAYPEAVCLKEKLCHTLVGQSKLECECLAEGDPRQGTICPVTDLCTGSTLTDPCICDGSGKDPAGCKCSPTSHPKLCVCDDDSDAIFDESIDTCDAVNDYDQLDDCTAATGAAGGSCKCLAGKAPIDCQCPLATTPGAYTKAICEAEKIAALPACSAGNTPPVSENTCKCVTDNTPENCVCPVVPAQLATIPVVRCQCLTTGDPRAGQTTPAGATCPAYCADNVYVEGCACDSSLEATYDKCREDKAYAGIQKCTALTAQTVGVATCICDGATNSPTHCVCPKDDDIAELAGVPSARCGCLSTDDPRAVAEGICPEYCVKESATADCTCDSALEEYTVADCTKEKDCAYDLAAQTKEDCPCTGATDPRIAGVCKPDTPATVDCTTITKDTPVTDCVCPTDKKELKADPRSGKGGLCAAGSMRAALAVVVSALIIPALILFF